MSDKRIGNVIQDGTAGDVVLLGFPHDQGVKINGGRGGAAGGPERFRGYVARIGTTQNPHEKIDLSNITIGDAGDISINLSLEKAHDQLTQKTREILAGGAIPFVVGGGNDQSFPNVSALLDHISGANVGVINIDAHLDVRPLKDGKAHSGSPFRLLLEDPRFDGKNFLEFAAQGMQCSREHADYVSKQKGRILWLDDLPPDNIAEVFSKNLETLAQSCESIFISFDMDSIAGSFAPGVSCPGSMGLTARDAFSIAKIAGSHPAVSLFDLSEYNPLVEAELTGRLAAGIFYFFCLEIPGIARNI
ncbi:MAG: formimidoylglutamase [Nitrospinales bacterium]